MKVSKKFKSIVLFLSILIIVLINYNNISLDKINDLFEIEKDLFSDNYNNNVIYNNKENITKDMQIVFCPKDNCFNLLNNTLSNANFDIKCAFYELDEKYIVQTLKKKSIQGINIDLVIDDKYLDEENMNILDNTNIEIFSDKNRKTRYNNYMHHKFCIIDNKTIITGSMNPTENGLYKNNNNVIKINSNLLAQNYNNEFKQLSNNYFGTNKIPKLVYNNISLIYRNETYIVSSYFCPQNDCLNKVLRELKSAKEKIYFADFVLTSDDISNILISKSYDIDVQGILETRTQNLKGSDYNKLKDKIDIFLDSNKNTMHHKFFVIDNNTVITGSMNPSSSGINYNDENLIVIKNNKINKLYTNEFLSLININ